MNLPTVSEVAIIDLNPESTRHADVYVNVRGGGLKRIPETNRSYESLHYTLLMPRGDDGWHFGLFKTDPVTLARLTTGQCHISPSEFHSYRMMQREKYFNSITQGKRCFQEWCCGMFYMAEKRRLDFIKNNQKKLKIEKYQGLFDAQEGDLSDVGVKVILPPSHTGSGRWYSEKYAGMLIRFL